MRITELNRNERKRIEKYEVGRLYINSIEDWNSFKEIADYASESMLITNKTRVEEEIKRTIKRIEDEIEFIKKLEKCENETQASGRVINCRPAAVARAGLDQHRQRPRGP